MSKYCYNEKAARKRIGCSRECFHYLIETGALKVRRTKVGGYRLYKWHVDNFDLVSYLLNENIRLRKEALDKQMIKEELSQLISKYLDI